MNKNVRKMMTPRQKHRRTTLYLISTRKQSNLKRLKVERAQQKENPYFYEV